MLIIPFDRRFDWKRPPLITLILLLLNLLAFFFWQGRDEEHTAAAVEYYYDSGLHALELPRYRDALLARGEAAFVEQWQERLAEPQAPWLWRMLSDGEFMQRLPGIVNRDYLAQDDREAALSVQREAVAAHMERLDFNKALPILKRLLTERPQDPALLKAAVTCARFTPAAEDYHQLAQQVFRLPSGPAEQEQWVLETYRDHVAQAKPRARLPAPTVRALAARFTQSGHFAEAERMVEVMVQHAATFTDAPAALVRLANALLRRHQGQRARHYFHLLLERFPTAPEAELARQVLQLQSV
jgi:tetratricopeptide (TPR) repeat protein